MVASERAWAVVLRLTTDFDASAIHALIESFRCYVARGDLEGADECGGYATIVAHTLEDARAFAAAATERGDVLGAYVRR